MSRAVARIIFLVLGIGLGTFSAAGEYFLDGDQKKDLVLHGRMTGHDNALYDVWIVPGYVPPARNARKGWKQSGEELKAYGRAGHYRKLRKTSRAWMRFARKDMLQEFALTGTRTAWTEAMGTAHQRVERRVFGWWFAYPWALLEASTESVLRTGIGIPASAATALGSFTVVPAAYVVAPAARSVTYAAVPGTALPLVAASWNTVIAPPLALAGQQPAAERADGFWMKRMQDPAEADIRARMIAWQAQWREDPALAEMRESQVASNKKHTENIAALRARIEAEEKARRDEVAAIEAERRRLVAKKTIEQAPALREELSTQGYTPARLQSLREVLQKTLQEQGMNEEEATRMLDELTGGDATLPGQQRDADEKTDPLLQIKDRL